MRFAARRRKPSVLSALIRRETNVQYASDRDLLLSYAEESSVLSCHRTKVCFFMRFFTGMVLLLILFSGRFQFD